MMEKMKEAHEAHMEKLEALKEKLKGGNDAEALANIEPPVEVPDPRMAKVTGGVKRVQPTKNPNNFSQLNEKPDDIILPEIE